ncbi:MAG: 30S ribosomal protein S20 [Candidatus Absconditabacteria bacterium]
MPIKKASKKALKRSMKLREINLGFKIEMKKAIKEVKKAAKAGSADNSEVLLQNMYSAIDKAARRNIVHKNNAARKKSRLTKLLSA